MDSPARPRTAIRRVGLLSRRTGKDKDGRIAVKEGGMNRDKRPITARALGRRDVLMLACALILAPHAALADPVKGLHPGSKDEAESSLSRRTTENARFKCATLATSKVKRMNARSSRFEM